MSGAKVSFWKRSRYALEACAVRGVGAVVPRLPRRTVIWLARVLGRLAYLLDRTGRTTALENLRCAFGDSLADKERKAIALRSFQNFARTMLDLFWFRRLDADSYSDVVKIRFPPGVEELARSRGAIWVTPHYGNFECTMMMGYRGFEFMIVMEAQKNPALTDIFRNRRSASGHKIILQEGAIIRLLKHLKGGGHAAFLPDLTIPPGRAATTIDCFGLKTCVTAAHALLASRTGLPVIPGIAIPHPDGTYTAEIFEPLEIPEGAGIPEIAQRCWDIFEPRIREAPEFWLWMYKHWRYLPPGKEAGKDFPAYANRKKAFDKMVRGNP